jgi:hypothetical protein
LFTTALFKKLREIGLAMVAVWVLVKVRPFNITFSVPKEIPPLAVVVAGVEVAAHESVCDAYTVQSDPPDQVSNPVTLKLSFAASVPPFKVIAGTVTVTAEGVANTANPLFTVSAPVFDNLPLKFTVA